MIDRITLTGAGLVIHDDHGKQLAAQTVVMGDGDVRVITTGDWPAELPLTPEAAKHMLEVYGRAYRATLFPTDLPRCVPKPPDDARWHDGPMLAR